MAGEGVHPGLAGSGGQLPAGRVHGVQAGVSAGLAEDGALLARTADGLARILGGEVRWLP